MQGRVDLKGIGSLCLDWDVSQTLGVSWDLSNCEHDSAHLWRPENQNSCWNTENEERDQTPEDEWLNSRREGGRERKRGRNGGWGREGEDEFTSLPGCPVWTLSQVAALVGWLYDDHPHWGGWIFFFTRPANSSANLSQEHPHWHTQEHCFTSYLRLLYPSQVDR